MNARFLFCSSLLGLGLTMLAGCGVEAASPTRADPALADQPLSLAGPVVAPDGWQFSRPVRMRGHLTFVDGQEITVMDPIYVVPAKSVAAR